MTEQQHHSDAATKTYNRTCGKHLTDQPTDATTQNDKRNHAIRRKQFRKCK